MAFFMTPLVGGRGKKSEEFAKIQDSTGLGYIGTNLRAANVSNKIPHCLACNIPRILEGSEERQWRLVKRETNESKNSHITLTKECGKSTTEHRPIQENITTDQRHLSTCLVLSMRSRAFLI